MSRYTSTKLDSILKQISSMGLSKSEYTMIKDSFEDPIVGRKLADAFEDPIVGNKLVESFEVPVFRKDFIEDPLKAVSNLDRYSLVAPRRDA